MALLRFIIRRYCAYTLLVTVSVTMLACLVDFFEKIRHIPVVGVKELLELLCIPCVTRIFGLFPAGMFIGTLLLHRELSEKHFYESFALVGGKKRSLFTLFFTASTLLAVGMVAGRELIITMLNRTTLLTIQPVVPLMIAPLNEETLGIFRSYNLINNTAQTTTLLTFDGNKRLQNETRSLTAHFNEHENELEVTNTSYKAPFLKAHIEQLRCYRQLYSVRQLASYAFSQAQLPQHKMFYQAQLTLWVKFLIDAMILPAISLTLANSIFFSPIVEYGALAAPFIVGLLLDRGVVIGISAAGKVR